MKSLLVFESDFHGGHIHGLCPEKLERLPSDDYDVDTTYPNLSPTQRRLAEIRKVNIDLLRIERRGKKWVYLNLGDQTHGDKFADSTKENRQVNQLLIAYNNMLPILKLKPDFVRIAVGTPAHDKGSSDSYILHNYYAMRFPNIDIATVWQGMFDFYGFRIDYRHHGINEGKREWTRMDSLRLYLKSEMWKELKAGNKPPDLYVRAHYHSDLMASHDEKYDGKWYHSRIITIPSMSGLECYTKTVVRDKTHLTNGMVVVNIVDGIMGEVEWWVDTIDIRHKEVLGESRIR